jgi:hypothetical protein
VKWYDYLFDILASAFTKQELKKAGAGDEALKGAVTRRIDLPTFGADEPQPPQGVLESRDLAHCHAELRKRYAMVKADFEAETGKQLFETCTWRSSLRQQNLYAVGRRGVPGEKVLTQIDGITKKSRHMVYPAQAVDVCVDSDPGPGKVAVWGAAAYAPLGPLCVKHGLIWGGSWTSFKDYPHMELPAAAA